MAKIAGIKRRAVTNYIAKIILIFHVGIEKIARISSLTANLFIHLKKFKLHKFLNKATNFNNLLRKQRFLANFKTTVGMINANISIIPQTMVNPLLFMNSTAFSNYRKEIIEIQILNLIKMSK